MSYMFKVQKGKKNLKLSTRNYIPIKNILQNDAEIKTFRHIKAEKILHRQNFTINVKENTLYRRKMIPNGNLDLKKGIKNTGNGECGNKYAYFSLRCN